LTGNLPDASSFYPCPIEAPGRRPPHIHVRVSAEGFKTLITQLYRLPDARQADVDFVLRLRP
jgi:protocatechuate 3,4-dioxygenase beta subunit